METCILKEVVTRIPQEHMMRTEVVIEQDVTPTHVIKILPMLSLLLKLGTLAVATCVWCPTLQLLIIVTRAVQVEI